jgi:BMFP domain-containing protein YqiC
MQTDNPLLDDLARVASGALGALTGMRGEVEARIRDQLERVLARMDMVTREEFDAVRAMAAKARGEQDRLLERIAALEARLDRLAAELAPRDLPAPPG